MIGAGPALAVHPDRGVDVLGHAVDAHAADRAERVDPDHRARPAPERRTPAVLRGGDHAIEDRLFVEYLAVTPSLMLERFEVIEVLRRLDEGQLRIVEIRQERGQEAGRRDVVRVEDADDVGVDVLERVVQVPRLGMLVGRPRDVARAERHGKLADLLAVPIIEDPRLVLRLERDRRRDRRQQDIGGLVVGRDQHGDTLASASRRRCPRCRCIDVPERDRIQDEPDRVVHLGDEQRDRDPPPVEGDRARQAPDEVGGGDGDREQRGGADDGLTAGRFWRR